LLWLLLHPAFLFNIAMNIGSSFVSAHGLPHAPLPSHRDGAGILFPYALDPCDLNHHHMHHINKGEPIAPTTIITRIRQGL
jgi:hypothetical protein